MFSLQMEIRREAFVWSSADCYFDMNTLFQPTLVVVQCWQVIRRSCAYYCAAETKTNLRVKLRYQNRSNEHKKNDLLKQDHGLISLNKVWIQMFY